MCLPPPHTIVFFFFNDTATTEIYTLSLHDALPIWHQCAVRPGIQGAAAERGTERCNAAGSAEQDRKSTRLNSSHQIISYAVFCLKKKKTLVTCTIATSTKPLHDDTHVPLQGNIAYS